MAFTRKAALRAAAAIAAAAETAAPGAVDVAPVDPIPQEVLAPPAIVEEVTPESRSGGLYDQIDAALDAMDNVETPTIMVSGTGTINTQKKTPNMTGGTVTFEPEAEKIPAEAPGKIPETCETQAPVSTGRANRRKQALEAAKK